MPNNATASAPRVPTMAALLGEGVTQAHTDYCAAHGHATHTVDGTDTGVCPRCGAVTAARVHTVYAMGTGEPILTTTDYAAARAALDAQPLTDPDAHPWRPAYIGSYDAPA
jgi:hypothetical protein